MLPRRHAALLAAAAAMPLRLLPLFHDEVTGYAVYRHAQRAARSAFHAV